jgi:nitrous oxidase accessory protein NosD
LALTPASECDYFVDSAAASGGDGSQARPWNDLNRHLDRRPGDVLCLRGAWTGSPKTYSYPTLILSTNGTASAPIVLQSYPGERVRLLNAPNDDGGVLDIRGDHWVVDGLIIDNNGHIKPAIDIDDTAAFVTVSANTIHNGRYHGIDLSGPDATIRNNHIYDFDAIDTDAHGITIHADTPDRALIEGNTFHDLSGDGIQYYCEPQGVFTDPATAPYDTRVIGNVFYRGTLARAENGIDMKCANGTTIVRDNEFFGFDGDMAAFNLHRQSTGVIFESNRIHDTGWAINIHSGDGQTPEDITIRNNLIYNINGTGWGGYGIYISGLRNGLVLHNTIVGARGASFYIAGDGLTNGAIRNNLIAGSAPAYLGDAGLTSVSLGPNGWFNAGGDLGASADTVSSQSAGFVNAATADYRLQEGSPARSKGIDSGVERDFEGDLRADGSQPDLGADEYVLRELYLPGISRFP